MYILLDTVKDYELLHDRTPHVKQTKINCLDHNHKAKTDKLTDRHL
jgi:hypothetical protein